MRYLLALLFLTSALCPAQTACGGMSGEVDGGGVDSANAVFSQIQQTTGFGSCDDSGCSAGTGHGTCWIEQFQRYPSLTGSSAEIYDYSTSDNALFYKKLAPDNWDGRYNAVDSVVFYYSVKLDANAQSYAQALEFDAFQFYFDNQGGGNTCDCTIVNGHCQQNGPNYCYRYMVGTQCDTANHNGGSFAHWDLWDTANGTWNNGLTSVDCHQLLDGNWHRVILYATINHSTKKYTFQTVQIDNGTPATLGSSFSAAGTNDHPNLGAQFQIDLKSSAGETDGYHEWFDDVRLCTLDPHTNCPSQ